MTLDPNLSEVKKEEDKNLLTADIDNSEEAKLQRSFNQEDSVPYTPTFERPTTVNQQPVPSDPARDQTINQLGANAQSINQGYQNLKDMTLQELSEYVSKAYNVPILDNGQVDLNQINGLLRQFNPMGLTDRINDLRTPGGMDEAKQRTYQDELLQLANRFQSNELLESQSNPVSEVVRAAVGAREQQIRSLGGFADLTGDTLKLYMNNVLGRPTDTSQRPWDEDGSKNSDYEKGNWVGFMPKLVHDNQTGWGRFARDIMEFRLMLRLTNKGPFRTPNAATAGAQKINFFTKAMRVSLDGAAADLLTENSEGGNIFNSMEENLPWLLPQVSAMFSVDSDDNPWEARIKTTAAGSAMNHVGWFLSSYWRGHRAARKARVAGETVESANEIGTKEYRRQMAKNILEAEDNASSAAASRFTEGRGISRADARDEFLRKYLTREDYARLIDQTTSSADRSAIEALAEKAGKDAGDTWDWNRYGSSRQLELDLGREPDPFVNPDGFSDVEKANYPGNPKRAVNEALEDAMNGGNGSPSTPFVNDNQIRSIALGNKRLREIVSEIAQDLSQSIMHGKLLRDTIPKGMSQQQFEVAAYKIAAPLLEQLDLFLEGGGKIDLGEMFKKQLKNPADKRLFEEVDGSIVQTAGPVQRSANIIALRSLARIASDVAASALTISDDLPIGRQFDMVTDAMKVLFVENKKLGIMWGLDGQALQKGFQLTPMAKASKEADLARFEQNGEELFKSLHDFQRNGDWEGIRDLLELWKLSDGKVRTQAHMLEFLRAKMSGGRMDDINIRGQTRTQLQGTFFNSILSGLRTAPKAIIGTNMIAYGRPLMAAIGSGLIRQDKKELAIALSTLDATIRAGAESWKMWKYNWDLGVNRKTQAYQGKFDIGSDMREWNVIGDHIRRYGTTIDKQAYGALDFSVRFNSSPWVKYSANAMGAGDAYARTIIGRQYMAIRSAQAALAEGIDPKNLKDFVRRKEELFREEIFTKNSDGMWIVSDKAANMAGNEAAMTTALEGSLKGFELIADWPGMRAFFPFVRTGFNYLDVTFQHTPVGLLRNRYQDLTAKGGPRNLQKYGLRPEDVAGEVALMEGRIATGTMATLALFGAAMSGRVTGDLPFDTQDRKIWKEYGVQPNSFVFDKPGGGKVYVSYKGIEIFNTLFATGANLVYGSHNLGETAIDNWGRKLTWMFANVLVEQSMLGGLGDLMDIFDANKSDDLRMSAATRIARSQFPFKGLSQDIGMLLDANQKEANTLIETLMKNDAGAKSILHPKYDVLSKGNKAKPLQHDPLNPMLRLFNRISPIAVVPVDGDPVRDALLEIRYPLPLILGEIDGVELSSRQRSELSKHLAESDLYKELLRLVNNPDYKETLAKYKGDELKNRDGWDLKTTWFYNEVESIFKKYKEEARGNMLADPRNHRLLTQIEIKEMQEGALEGGYSGDIDAVKTDIERLKELAN